MKKRKNMTYLEEVEVALQKARAKRPWLPMRFFDPSKENVGSYRPRVSEYGEGAMCGDSCHPKAGWTKTGFHTAAYIWSDKRVEEQR